MTIITKASLAAELRVSKARVSQYVKRGLPVLSDGKLDRDQALNWVAENHRSLYSKPEGVGAKRAKQLSAEGKADRRPSQNARTRVEPDGDDAKAYGVLQAVVAQTGRVAGESAIRAGLPVRTAYLMSNLVILALTDVAEAELARQGARKFTRGWTFIETIDAQLQAAELDWPALAEKAGTSFDEDDWYGDVDEIRHPPHSPETGAL